MAQVVKCLPAMKKRQEKYTGAGVQSPSRPCPMDVSIFNTSVMNRWGNKSIASWALWAARTNDWASWRGCGNHFIADQSEAQVTPQSFQLCGAEVGATGSEVNWISGHPASVQKIRERSVWKKNTHIQLMLEKCCKWNKNQSFLLFKGRKWWTTCGMLSYSSSASVLGVSGCKPCEFWCRQGRGSFQLQLTGMQLKSHDLGQGI